MRQTADEHYDAPEEPAPENGVVDLVAEIRRCMAYHDVVFTDEAAGLVARRVIERAAGGRIWSVNDEVYRLAMEAKRALGVIQ